jgi:hypothetical protein
MADIDARAVRTILQYLDKIKIEDEKVLAARKKIGSNLWYHLSVNGCKNPTKWIQEDTDDC